jgi:4-hydroxybenzoate polyprenyltransferase
VQTLRPHQWSKNALVVMPLVFSRSLASVQAVEQSGLALLAFCAASSAIYQVNDVRDAESDRRHPIKSMRPIASGVVSPAAALALAFLLLGVAAGCSWLLPAGFRAVLGLYVALNAGYSFGLKRVVILDVLLVALGFVLRAVAGSAAIGVHATPWIILCTLLLAIMVSFGKRRNEMSVLDSAAAGHRSTLAEYTEPMLDCMIAVSGASVVITYALYTMADETVGRFGSRNLLLTMPFVLFGLFRYLLLLYTSSEGDPARLFVIDRPTLVNALLWGATVCFLIYGPLRVDLF